MPPVPTGPVANGPVPSRRSRTALALVLLELALLAGCGGGTSEAASSQAGSGRPPRPQPDAGAPLDDAARAARGLPPQLPRSSDPRILAATAALERLDAEAAGRELLALGEGFDAELLRARLAALEGDAVGAVRRLEALRAGHGDQSRLYATAGEIHAAAGRLRSAEEEIRAGLDRCGPTPALSRARGVLALAREGGARVGLNHLLEARAVDPELPFLAWPLCQAHLLLGRRALADGALVDAIGHGRAALLAQPGEIEARLLLADALAAAGEFDEALELLEGLLEDLADSQPVRATLAQTSKQAATAALVEGRRDAAVERTLRARELGMPEGELGFGATLLAEEAQRALEQGVEAFEAGDAARAEERFERALRLDPHSLAARNHLGVVLFRRGAYAAAAGHWRTLLDAARAEGLELPDPVHLNLARALYLDGRPDEVRALLSAELERDPDGPWADAARELLERLNAEAAGPGGDDR